MDEVNPSDLAEMRSLKTKYNKAKDLLDKIAALQLRFEPLLAAFNTTKNEVDKSANDAREKLSTIENLRNDASSFVAEIKSSLEKTQSSIETVDEGLRRFENISGKVEGSVGEIEANVSAVSGLKADIELAKTTAQQKLVDTEVLLGQVQEKIERMQGAYEAFIAVQAKIDDENSGLEATLAQTRELSKTSSSVFAEIRTFRDESKQHLDEIGQYRLASEESINKINESLTSVEGKKLEISKIADLITDTGFANSFQERKKTLGKNAYVWLIVLVIGTLILLGLLNYYYFIDEAQFSDINFVFSRITLTAPLLLLVAFAIKRYGSERDLEERYAFKAAVAVVMRNHADFLI
jgi:chromosome segregation ATPase